MDWIGGLVRNHFLGDHAFWRNGSFWLTAAAILLPFGLVLFALRLAPVRAGVRYLRRS